MEAFLRRVEESHRAELQSPPHSAASAAARAMMEGSSRGVVNWHALDPVSAEHTLADLTEFLQWAIPRWFFSTEQFPHGCWWQHPDVIEEVTAWWGLWKVTLGNPGAHPAEAVAFHEHTAMLKERLLMAYRGRCRHDHEESIALPDVGDPGAGQ